MDQSNKNNQSNIKIDELLKVKYQCMKCKENKFKIIDVSRFFDPSEGTIYNYTCTNCYYSFNK